MKTSSQNGLIEFFDNQVKRGALSAQDAADLTAGRKQFQGEEIFLRKQLSGTSGLVEFINENDVKKNCITNLSKGAVPAEKNIIVDKIGFRFGWAATNVDAAAVDYSNAVFHLGDVTADAGVSATGDSVYARRIPVQIQNAEYELRVDGAIMDAGRVEDLLTQNVAVDATNGDDKNFKQLAWAKLFLADKRVALDIKFPENGAAVPAGFYYMEFVAKGLGLGKRQA